MAIRAGKVIKHYRELAGMKKVELAAALGVVEGTVRNWETGRAPPPTRMFDQIGEVLQFNPLHLLVGIEDLPLAEKILLAVTQLPERDKDLLEAFVERLTGGRGLETKEGEIR